MGRMGDLAIETQGDEVEDPDDFGVERGVPFTRKRAFYRVESAQARDLAMLLASVHSDEAVAASSSSFRDRERISGGVSVLDAMSGCGVRCVRYLLQGEVSSVHANDADPNVMDTLSENLTNAHARGATGVSSVTNVDAHRLLAKCYLDEARYDIVDVDSFGSENLVSATMRCVKLGGYAYLTSTDALALCGKSPGALSANYGGAIVAPNTQGVNELGLRVFVGDAVRKPELVEILDHENGIRAESIEKIYENRIRHDPADLNGARELAQDTAAIRLGLFFRDESRPRYEETRSIEKHTAREKMDLLEEEFDSYAV